MFSPPWLEDHWITLRRISLRSGDYRESIFSFDCDKESPIYISHQSPSYFLFDTKTISTRTRNSLLPHLYLLPKHSSYLCNYLQMLMIISHNLEVRPEDLLVSEPQRPRFTETTVWDEMSRVLYSRAGISGGSRVDKVHETDCKERHMRSQ